MLFIPITIGAAAFQVARNAIQRGLLAGGGPWGATLVRFLFGLPFSLAFVSIAWSFTPDSTPNFNALFWVAAGVGAAAQIGATAALLVSIHRSGFGLAAILQQSSLPFAALLGWAAMGEGMTVPGWIGILMASGGLIAIAWPRGGGAVAGGMSGAMLGLLSGALYAISLNTFRVANLTVEPDHPILGAVLTTSATQAMQTVGLVAWLWWRDSKALVSVLRAWRSSLSAGFFGAAASALWLMALGLAPAGQVRAVGVVEMPIAAMTGRRLFAERLSWRQIMLACVVALGVVLVALG